jgi:phosphate transport system substrate-binding protein
MKPPRFSLAVFAAIGCLFSVYGQQEEPLVIQGSNTFGEELGPQLVAAFEGKNPGAKIVLGTLGSGAGLDALIEGQCAMAPASRVANEDELRRARAAGVKLRAQSIGSYGVAVIVNAKNPLKSLSGKEVQGIFTGEITNWSQVGGPAATIHVWVRNDQSGSALGFRELAMHTRPYAPSAVGLATYQEILAEVKADPVGIGYCGIGTIPEGVRAVLINGIPANRAAINEGLYPYARTLFLYTNPATESRLGKKFLRFVQSRDGQSLLVANGFVPRLPVELDRTGIAP